VVSQTEKEFVYKNSIYFALLVHRHFCLGVHFVRNILSFYIQLISQFVKPPSDTLIRYFNMLHLAPSPSSVRFNLNGIVEMSLFKICFLINQVI
jgi:hypothetical protein